MVERKAFLASPKHQYRVSQCREHDCSSNNKKNGVTMSTQVRLIPRMDFDYKENNQKKAFLANPTH